MKGGRASALLIRCFVCALYALFISHQRLERRLKAANQQLEVRRQAELELEKAAHERQEKKVCAADCGRKRAAGASREGISHVQPVFSFFFPLFRSPQQAASTPDTFSLFDLVASRFSEVQLPPDEILAHLYAQFEEQERADQNFQGEVANGDDNGAMAEGEQQQM